MIFMTVSPFESFVFKNPELKNRFVMADKATFMHPGE